MTLWISGIASMLLYTYSIVSITVNLASLLYLWYIIGKATESGAIYYGLMILFSVCYCLL